MLAAANGGFECIRSCEYLTCFAVLFQTECSFKGLDTGNACSCILTLRLTFLSSLHCCLSKASGWRDSRCSALLCQLQDTDMVMPGPETELTLAACPRKDLKLEL